MRLEKLEVRHLPGIENRFTVEALSPGLNLIVGPNGSGKTSLCRLVERAFWQLSAGPGHSDATLILRDDESQLRADIAATVTWQREGAVCDAPVVPDAYLRNCFFLNLRDLIDINSATQDNPLTEKVQVAMAGGFDLHGVMDGYRLGRFEGNKEAKELDVALNDLQAVRLEQEGLKSQQERLDSLRRQSKEAREAAEEVTQLKALRDLIITAEELGQVRAELGKLPAELPMLQGQELDRLDELDRDIDSCQLELAAVERKVESLDQELKSLAVPESTPDDETVGSQVVLAQQLCAAAERLRESKQRAETIQKGLESVLKSIGSDLDSEHLLQVLTSDRLADLESKLSDVTSCRSELAVLASRRKLLCTEAEELKQGNDEQNDLQGLRDRASCLRSWLSSCGNTAAVVSEERPSPIALYVTGVVLIAAGLILGFLVSPWALFLSGLGLGMIGMLLVRGKSGQTSGDSGQVALERQYADLVGGSVPFTWERSSVTEQLHGLEKSIAEIQVREERQSVVRESLRSIDQEEKDIEAARDEAQEVLNRFLADNKLSLVGEELNARLLLNWLEKFVAGYTDLKAAEQVVLGESELCAGLKERLSSFLSEYGCDCSGDALELQAEVKRFEQRLIKHKQARSSMATCREQLQMLRQQLEKLTSRRGQLLSMCKLDDETARETLKQRLSQLPRYSELVDRQRVLESEISKLKLSCPPTDELLMPVLAEVEENIGNKQELADRFAPLIADVARIEEQIHAAEMNHKLSDAMVRCENARNQLDDVGADMIRKAGAGFLLREVDREYQLENQPEVVVSAGDYFQKFTYGLYELRVDTGGAGARFYAFNNNEQRGYELTELSDGTRIQLLLAVRIAFTDHIEHGSSLPLFLDEPLTTSDPVRFRAIAEALTILSRDENRQILYFTSNPNDLPVWNQVATDIGGGEPKIFDLAELRGISRRIHIDDSKAESVASQYPVPQEGQGPEDYAEALGVECPDLHKVVETWHFFFAAGFDLKLCYRLLKLYRCERIGQWLALRGNEENRKVLDEWVGPDAVNRIQARIHLLKALRDSWSVGRGKPLTPVVFADCEFISETFSSRFAELIKEMGTSAEAFVRVVNEGHHKNVKRFQNKEELEDYLVETGYLDQRSVMSDAEVLLTAERICEQDLKDGLVSRDEIRRTYDQLRALAGE